MYCPNCGTQTSDDQKFCRACGVSLGQLPQPPAWQPQKTVDVQTGSLPSGGAGENEDLRRRYMRLGFILFWSGIMLALLLGILGDATTSLSWRLGKFIEHLSALGVPVVLGGLGVMIYSRLFPAAGSHEPYSPRALPYPSSVVNQPGQAAPGFDRTDHQPAPSVTEHTTYGLVQQRPGPATGRG